MFFRCCALTSSVSAGSKSWDQKWVLNSQWAGNWKLKLLD